MPSLRVPDHEHHARHAGAGRGYASLRRRSHEAISALSHGASRLLHTTRRDAHDMPEIDSDAGERIIRTAQTPAFVVVLIVGSTLASSGSAAASRLVDPPAARPPAVDALDVGPPRNGAPVAPSLSDAQGHITNEYWHTFNLVLDELNQSDSGGGALNPTAPVQPRTQCVPSCGDVRVEDPAATNSPQPVPEKSQPLITPSLPDQFSVPPIPTATPGGAQPISDVSPPPNSVAPVDGLTVQPPNGIGAGPADPAN